MKRLLTLAFVFAMLLGVFGFATVAPNAASDVPGVSALSPQPAEAHELFPGTWALSSQWERQPGTYPACLNHRYSEAGRYIGKWYYLSGGIMVYSHTHYGAWTIRYGLSC